VLKGYVLDIQARPLPADAQRAVQVRLMGCPLRCAWCNTPQAWDCAVRMGHNESMCQHCFRCAMGCPNRALTKSSGMVARNQAACTACGRCHGSCPGGAMERFGHRMSVDEVVSRATASLGQPDDRDGQVTVGGGEPTAQPAFLCALLSLFREHGWRTEVQTCGHFSPSLLTDLCRLADHIVFDVKTLNGARHEALTGVRNDLILKNLRHLLRGVAGARVVPCIPLVPGLCAGESELRDVVVWLRAHGHAGDVRLIPFEAPDREHWRRLGRRADFRALPEVPVATTVLAVRIVEEAGLRPVVAW
jgi:pyruvate formate lyase activating enzyme